MAKSNPVLFPLSQDYTDMLLFSHMFWSPVPSSVTSEFGLQILSLQKYSAPKLTHSYQEMIFTTKNVSLLSECAKLHTFRVKFNYL